MSEEQRKLRLYRTLLLCTGATYLGWWLFVRLALPAAFNPFLSRAAVVALFGVAFAASFALQSVARNLDGWFTLCCCLATAHYFYLFDQNEADLNWVIGSYITVTAVCAILQTARSLLTYSAVVTALSVVVILRDPGLSFVVFLPGIVTVLLFANVGLWGRLKLLARLQESNRRIESLFDAGFEGIAVHDQGLIREVNGAFARLVGEPRDALIGRSLAELIAPGEAFPGGETTASSPTPHELELKRRDGSHVSVEVNDKQHILNGKEMRLVAVRDLTARRRAEVALMHANRELESFSYSVAHDLRAPLRGLEGFTQILLGEYSARLDERGRDYLQRIRTGAERMGSLIDDLLMLSRVTRAELVRRPVDLSRLARQVVDQLRTREPGRQISVSIQDGMNAEGDEKLLLILFENLIGNAWKFTSKTPEARIDIGARAGPEGVVYAVHDNGAGFDMAYAHKLFIPFQRLHDIGQYPGTGIGLATVQRIVHRHGGRVWAEAVVNEGATFHFTLHAGRAARD